MSKLTAVAYYGGIPFRNNNPEKPMILDNFLKGVTNVGDNGIAHKGLNAIPCDVALIQGFVHEHGKEAPHLQLRKNAFDLQIKNKKKALIVDSNLFLYSDPGNSKRYLRYSFNGVFPTTGFYFDKDIDPARWEKISKKLNIQLKPWRSTGDHILICLQRNGGWSMRGLSVQEWLDKTIIEIRKHSKKRPIIVRFHPGDKKMPRLIKINHKNVRISNNTSDIRKDLVNAWATVLYNSSPAVASAIEGVPVFLTDPKPEHSQAHTVSNTDISKIENPITPDRQDWIEKLSMCHWDFEELKSGEAWTFFRKYV
jgi:hypothetical protein